MLEIRIGMRVLLLGRPGAIPAPLQRASDGLALRSFYARLAQDRIALNRLRAGWRTIAPGVATSQSDRVMLVDQLRRHVEAGRIAAALLDPRGQVPAANPQEKAEKPKLIHLKGQDEDLILAPRGTLPGPIRSLTDNPGAAAFLGRLRAGHPIESALFRHARLLGGNEGMAPVNLRQMVVTQVQQGRLDAVLIRSQIHRSMAAPVLPRRDFGKMDRTAKVAEAIQRSLPFLEGDVHAAVVEMCKPANLMIMAGVFAAMGLAQLYPPAGLAIDAAVFITAAFTIGWKSVEMLRAAVEATVVALGAGDEKALDHAGRLYADAFEALGAVAIAALTARFAGKKVGKAIDERQGAAGSAASRPSPRPASRDPEPTPQPKPKPPPVASPLEALKQSLVKRGVPASTLSKLETEEQAKAFQETLDAIERIDFSKLKSKSGSLFYSGKVGDDPAWRVAERMAKEKNMNWITDVSDGALDKHRGVIPQDAMDYLDRKLSTELAKNVSGDVEILGDPASIRKTSVFYQNELPELLKNPNISPASKEKILQLQGVLDAQFAPPGG